MCQTFSAGYVHHLFKARELLGYRLATIHNLRFFHRLMDQIRESILQDRFQLYREAFWETHTPVQEPQPSRGVDDQY